jgi:two-component system, NtrC family, nitrogen regulation response regulator GlnG
VRDDSTMSSGMHSQGQHVRAALGLRILCHPRLERVDETAILFDRARPGRAVINRHQPVFRTNDGKTSDGLASSRVSRRPIELRYSADGSIELDVNGSQAVWLDERPLPDKRKLSEQELEVGVTLRLGGFVLLWLGPIESEPEPSPLSELRGDSRQMRMLRSEILRVADLPISVLLRGETGVGKELVATALHRYSQRRHGPLITVNMSAVPASMAASELFGHVKGAFTGAHSPRVGYFAQARKGTLFLDEIGETASDVQPMLLRALEQGVIQPLGSKPEHVDVRLIAATDSDLEAAVARGMFKAPLLRRFGYEIHVPALRQRREDVAGLFMGFLRAEMLTFGEFARITADDPDRAPWLAADLVASLVRYDWPGNVRELRNATRRFAVHNQARDRASASPLRLSMPGLQLLSASEPIPSVRRPSDGLSESEIAAALARQSYALDATAAELGVSRSWLHQFINSCSTFRKAKDLELWEIEGALEKHSGDLKAAALELRVSARGLRLQLSRLASEQRLAGRPPKQAHADDD